MILKINLESKKCSFWNVAIAEIFLSKLKNKTGNSKFYIIIRNRRFNLFSKF